MLTVLLVGSSPEPASSTPASEPAKSASKLASEQAAETGEPVEILSERTERSQVFANPSGTFTLEQSTLPTRVNTPEGWKNLDATLVRGTDGLIRPRVTAVAMAFSGGGSTPLITLTDEGERLDLRWPATLPTPTISGNTLTYPSVLPDVDLRLTVLTHGYRQVLIVRTPQAAQNPALKKVILRFDAPGLTVKGAEGGGIEAVDQLGNTIFEAPAPVMWDSRGNGSADGPGADDRSLDSLEGDKTVPLPVEIGSNTIAVVPASSLISDPAVVYPLYIDPGFSGKPAGHAMIDRAYPSSSYWNWTADQSVGYQNFDAWSHKRLFFSFFVADIAGADVTRAVFRVNQVYSASCTTSEIEAWETNRFTPSATWSNSSGSSLWVREVANASTPGSGRVGCPEGRLTEFGVTGLLDQRVGLNANYVYLGLRAADESNPMVWKRFTANATLGIEYNHPPDQPTADDLKIGRGNHELPCHTSGTGYPTTGDKPTPLRAFLTDKDGWGGDKVTGEFEVWQPGGDRKFWGKSEELLPGRDFSPISAVHLLDGVYWWHVRVSDGTSTSAWSPPCFFRLDTRYPPGPVPVLVTDPAPCPEQPDPVPEIWEPCYQIGQVLTFDIVARVEPAVKFGWSVNSPGPMHEVPATDGGQRARVTTTLTHFGPSRIYVWAWDSAGHISPYSYASIYVIDSERTGGWKIDEGQGSALNDTLGLAPNTPLYTVPSVTWGSGDNAANVPSDRAVIMNGATDGTGGTASTNALDVVQTSQSFSVGARVKLSSAYLTDQIAVSEDGPAISGFTLGMHSQTVAAGSRTVEWNFCIANPEAPSTRACVAKSLGYDGDWVHLTAVYSGAARRMELYIDGRLQARRWLTWTARPTIDADGRLRIGRAVEDNIAKYYLRGYIDDVSVFNGYINDHTAFKLYEEK